ncbi:MAG: hypothetical protein ACE5EO_04105 [Candidatus Krumholzibacteriia bacterium]
MKTALNMVLVAGAVVAMFALPAQAGDVEGTIRLGGVVVDEDVGDFSAMQETYNLYDGFNLTGIRLRGSFDPGTYPRSFFSLDLRDLNQDSRKGRFEFRIPSVISFKTSYDQNRQVFDPARAVSSERRDWRFGSRVTPAPWMLLSADYSRMSRKGSRLGFPAGVQSDLGTGYDYTLKSGRFEGQFRRGPRFVALAYEFSDYSDDLFDTADRDGKVFSVRLFLPGVFTDKLTHTLRASYGKSELSNTALEHTTKSFQYSGVLRPVQRFQFKYKFLARRVEDDATLLRTDDFQNDFDARYWHRYGAVWGGYSYELSDDDRSLTRYNTYRGGTKVRIPGVMRASVHYSNRSKEDKDDFTLLRDSEAERTEAKIDVYPIKKVTLGTRYVIRNRELHDIGVDTEGESISGYLRYDSRLWGRLSAALSADYSYSEDNFDDRVGSFNTRSQFVTGRVEPSYGAFKSAAGITFTDVARDLDIEKSTLFLEAVYTYRNVYHLEVKYNAYNYDDFILLNRYYTANVVWFNIAYDFGAGK